MTTNGRNNTLVKRWTAGLGLVIAILTTLVLLESFGWRPVTANELRDEHVYSIETRIIIREDAMRDARHSLRAVQRSIVMLEGEGRDVPELFYTDKVDFEIELETLDRQLSELREELVE